MGYTRHKIDDSVENITRAIDNYIVGFKAHRNKCILKSRLIEGMTFEELAEEFDISVRQVKKIVYDNEQIITKHLRAEE